MSGRPHSCCLIYSSFQMAPIYKQNLTVRKLKTKTTCSSVYIVSWVSSPQQTLLSCCECQEEPECFQSVRNSFGSSLETPCHKHISENNTTFSRGKSTLVLWYTDETYRHEDWEVGTEGFRKQLDGHLLTPGRWIVQLEESSIHFSQHIQINVECDIQILV